MKVATFLCTSALGIPPHDMMVGGVSVGRVGWGGGTEYLVGKTCLVFLFGVQCSQWCCSQLKCGIECVGSAGLTVSTVSTVTLDAKEGNPSH